MKLVFISDTHGYHNHLKDLEGDIIIHTGDLSMKGEPDEVADFLGWYKDLNFRHKIFIAGNHDFYFEEANEFELKQMIPKEIIYLNDSGILIDGLECWGSPVQPWFHNWAFNRNRGKDISKHWELIPNKVDILITHGPPLGILDKTTRFEDVGCEDLLNKVNIVKPRIHAFGHIHEAYGIKELSGTKFINASVLNENYRLVNPPIEVFIT